ncbi:hypothetical protein J6590_000658 [Homalodisca vitripennis]|nr:hypothetical protein J6590_000658 [Homalodisca vitripennis]
MRTAWAMDIATTCESWNNLEVHHDVINHGNGSEMPRQVENSLRRGGWNGTVETMGAHLDLPNSEGDSPNRLTATTQDEATRKSPSFANPGSTWGFIMMKLIKERFTMSQLTG